MAQTPTQSNAQPPVQTRVALVTGAGRRVGRVIALALARHGWDVAVHCHRSRAEADAVAAEIIAMGRRAAVLQADLSDEAAASRLVGDCIAALGTPTCLVNNASLFQYDVATSFSYASLDTHMRTNVAAPLLLSRELHRALTAGDAEHRGVVINLLDQKLDNLNPDFLSYTLSKAALSTATMQLAQALAPALRVVGVAPGITMVSGDQSSGGFARAHQMTPLGQSSTPEDIAEAVCYLATARAVTGTTLFVDGGQHLMPLARDVMFLTE
ncbi:SDR family oxidoreductase [Ralstonia insidiosa]|jgi:NAD(P)-dependent dehydrogenase (short-subunit alcohol dehydrogenase family)|uniref:KR domain protein n=1 Tax=Ralstonia insidiosa TaxID=190721 RepID=A0A191ZSF5_9RALS|nr:MULTISPECIES: SDR family oxidoreductase [Ralstonia]ANH72075.1 KR domain protein [Ralstonia insidiosa]ANJ71031.1 short chain dehydrogenase [Ralstonia insidiosa]EPX95172.1 short-chain dehydrogenase [Ralstonia sp. AU12-08]KAB0471608.1 SDR family oxidoreductase [Ralstonia insidiosa]MBY4708462.1 SDR family oxidoreductase [Ralstonia insidiosa]